LSESVYTLRDALAAADYRVGGVEEDRAFLAESPERAVWSIVFETAAELLEGWQATQADAIERTQALRPEKSWELYLVLGSELEPDEGSEAALDAVRRDTSYARKVLALGLETISIADLDAYLAPLKPLRVFEQPEGSDALSRLEELVRASGSADEVEVLEAFKENRPLFGGL
jgi:hypothetical protein